MAAPAAVVPAVAPAAGAPAAPDFAALAIATDLEIAQLEQQLVVLRARAAWYKRKLRQQEFAQLAARHGPVDGQAELEASQGDERLPEGPRPAQARRAASRAAPPMSNAKKLKKEPRPQGTCIACWNIGRGKAQGVTHSWDGTCDPKAAKARRDALAAAAADEGAAEAAGAADAEAAGAADAAAAAEAAGAADADVGADA